MKRVLTLFSFALFLVACGSDEPQPDIQKATSSNSDTSKSEAVGSPEIRNADTTREKPPLDLGTIAFSVGPHEMNFENLDRNSTQLKLRDGFATLLYQEKGSQRKLMVALRNVDTQGNLAGTYDVGERGRDVAQATVTALNIVSKNEHVTMSSGTVTVEAIDATGVCKVKWDGTGHAIRDGAQQNPYPMKGDVSMVFHSVVDTRSGK